MGASNGRDGIRIPDAAAGVDSRNKRHFSLAQMQPQRIFDKTHNGNQVKRSPLPSFMKDDANASTGAALRRLQAANDLPATGVPDHETV
jgi:hypothetical protein